MYRVSKPQPNHSTHHVISKRGTSERTLQSDVWKRKAAIAYWEYEVRKVFSRWSK